jgi:hypothetical protein
MKDLAKEGMKIMDWKNLPNLRFSFLSNTCNQILLLLLCSYTRGMTETTNPDWAAAHR